MPHLPKEWRFLKAAWIYAFAATGSQGAATEAVASALAATLARPDAAATGRRRRFLLANLHRRCAKAAAPAGESADPQLEPFRKLQEPGRSALLMLYLRLLPVDEIADVVGCGAKEIPDMLAAARSGLESNWGGMP
jgi:DNA-directed RNA polymerase specialized sigma24 family protein